MAAGMDAYVSKPFQAEELFATIEQLVSYANAARPEAGPEVSAEPVVAKTAPSLIDVNEALGRMGGSPEVLAEVTGIFLDGYPEQFEQLKAAVETRELLAELWREVE